MKETNDHEVCEKTLSYAPGSVVGPKEFDHALECDDCWKAMVRWMDAEVITIPDIEERAKRLAGAAEVIAAMIADDAASEHRRLSSVSVKIADQEISLADVLGGNNEARLFHGPWKAPRKRSRKAKEEPVCEKPESESSPARTGECPVEPRSAPDDATEDECQRRRRLAGEWSRRDNAAAVASAPAGGGGVTDELALQHVFDIPLQRGACAPENACAGEGTFMYDGKRACMQCIEIYGSCPLLPALLKKISVGAMMIELDLEEVPGSISH
ncbi:MAG TPA: hypothetical protein VNA69_20580 [Thermoanaerobaculia bacterium]|nr:hypothetical protein [Thermoanaerobaculia bacterium]